MKSRKEEYIQFIKENPLLTYSEYAEHFGVNRKSFKEALKKYGINEEGMKPDFLLGVPFREFEEYAQTHFAVEIAEHYNLNVTSVHKVCRQNQIEYYRRAVTDKNKVPATRLKRTGLAIDMIKTLGKTYTYEAISKVFGYSAKHIRTLCEGS